MGRKNDELREEGGGVSLFQEEAVVGRRPVRVREENDVWLGDGAADGARGWGKRKLLFRVCAVDFITTKP